MEARVKLGQRRWRNILEQGAAGKFRLRDPRDENCRLTHFGGQVAKAAGRFAIGPQGDSHRGVGNYFHAGRSFRRVAFTAFSKDSNSRGDSFGREVAASRAAASVPLGGISRSITAEKVSSRPVFHEANRV